MSDSPVVTTVAGVVHPGDGDRAWARLRDPRALVETGTAFLVADGSAARLRLLDTSFERSTTVAGYPRGQVSTGPLPAHQVALGELGGIAYDLDNDEIFLADASERCIRVVTITGDPSTWTLETVFGECGSDSQHIDGDATEARFAAPGGMALVGSTLLIADPTAHVIRRADLGTGQVDTIAGTPFLPGYCCEGGTAAEALFDGPTALAVDASGSLFVADTNNHRVRRLVQLSGTVGPASLVDSVLGDGSPGSGGTGSPSAAFPVHAPAGLAFDSFGNLIASGGEVIRLVTPGVDSGVVGGSGSVLSIYGEAPRVDFPESTTRCLAAVLPRGDDRVLVSDRCLGLLIELTRTRQ